MPFLKEILRKEIDNRNSPSTILELRILHYSNNIRLEHFLSSCIDLAINHNADSNFLLNKIENYAELHADRCQRCNSNGKCHTLTDILAIPEILFL